MIPSKNNHAGSTTASGHINIIASPNTVRNEFVHYMQGKDTIVLMKGW